MILKLCAKIPNESPRILAVSSWPRSKSISYIILLIDFQHVLNFPLKNALLLFQNNYKLQRSLTIISEVDNYNHAIWIWIELEHVWPNKPKPCSSEVFTEKNLITCPCIMDWGTGHRRCWSETGESIVMVSREGTNEKCHQQNYSFT